MPTDSVSRLLSWEQGRLSCLEARPRLTAGLRFWTTAPTLCGIVLSVAAALTAVLSLPVACVGDPGASCRCDCLAFAVQLGRAWTPEVAEKNSPVPRWARSSEQWNPQGAGAAMEAPGGARAEAGPRRAAQISVIFFPGRNAGLEGCVAGALQGGPQALVGSGEWGEVAFCCPQC